MARPPRTKEEITRIRERIVEAAERVLGARGVRGLSMEEVAREAELAAPSLYGYFDGRDEILSAVVERTMRRVVGCIEPGPAGSDPAVVLAVIAERLLELAWSNRAVAELLLSRRLAVDDGLRDRLRELHHEARAALERVLGPHVPPDGHPLPFLSAAFLGLVRAEWARIALAAPDQPGDLRRRAAALVHLFLHGALARSLEHGS